MGGFWFPHMQRLIQTRAIVLHEEGASAFPNTRYAGGGHSLGKSLGTHGFPQQVLQGSGLGLVLLNLYTNLELGVSSEVTLAKLLDLGLLFGGPQ